MASDSFEAQTSGNVNQAFDSYLDVNPVKCREWTDDDIVIPSFKLDSMLDRRTMIVDEDEHDMEIDI